MEPTDLTIEILKGIRDEQRLMREEQRLTRAEAHETNERLGRLERRQVETEVRLSTEIVGLVGAVHEVRDALREDRDLRARVDDHERRLAVVESRSA